MRTRDGRGKGSPRHENREKCYPMGLGGNGIYLLKIIQEGSDIESAVGGRGTPKRGEEIESKGFKFSEGPLGEKSDGFVGMEKEDWSKAGSVSVEKRSGTQTHQENKTARHLEGKREGRVYSKRSARTKGLHVTRGGWIKLTKQAGEQKNVTKKKKQRGKRAKGGKKKAKKWETRDVRPSKSEKKIIKN